MTQSDEDWRAPEVTPHELLRAELLTSALVDWVPLVEVETVIHHYNLADTHAARQDLALRTIRSLLEDGLMLIGDLPFPGEKLAGWDLSIDAALERVYELYVTGYEDRLSWDFKIWLGPTPAGERLAHTFRAQRTRLAHALTSAVLDHRGVSHLSSEWESEHERIRAAGGVTDEDLAATFGPSWRPVVAIICRTYGIADTPVWGQLEALWSEQWYEHAVPPDYPGIPTSRCDRAVADHGREKMLQRAIYALDTGGGRGGRDAARNAIHAAMITDLVGIANTELGVLTQDDLSVMERPWITVTEQGSA